MYIVCRQRGRNINKKGITMPTMPIFIMNHFQSVRTHALQSQMLRMSQISSAI